MIKVLPGTYVSDGQRYALTFRRQGDVRDPVTVEAVKPGTVTLENADPQRQTFGAWVVHATGLRLRGLRFRVLTTRGSNLDAGAMLIEDSSKIEVDDCTFNEVSGSAISIRGAIGRRSSDIWVIDSDFRPSGPKPTTQVTGLGYAPSEYFGSKGSHWIYAGQYGDERTWEVVSGVERLVVVNDVFVGSTAGRDVQLGPQARNSYVVDNTFYGNQASSAIGRDTAAVYAGQGVQLFSNSSNPSFITGFNTVANNLFVDLEGTAVSGSGPAEPGNVVDYNLVWQVATGIRAGNHPFVDEVGGSRLFTLGKSNTGRAPRLTDPLRYDFRPRRTSPALRLAEPDLAYPYDAAGRRRPARPAVGAFEADCGGNVC